jgi:Zn-dependent protease
MLGKHITLFKLLGFPIRIDVSWVVIAALVTWSWATGVFPEQYEGLSERTYWLMGAGGAIGFFASILFHELSHSIVARMLGLKMNGITLFIFGGVAEMDDEPASAKVEFLMAVAGPISSIILGFLLTALYIVGFRMQWPVPINGVVGYLGAMNIFLAIFNLVPAFPLDGGRILRAGLWSWRKNIRSATRTASRIGSGFGLALIFTGLYFILFEYQLGGMWLCLIGMFLRFAAGRSYQQLLTRTALQGEPIGRFMEPEPIAVPPSMPIEDFVENYIYRYHFKMFPVVEDGRLVGCITMQKLKDIPRNDWSGLTVGDVSVQCTGENTISPYEDSLRALSKMNRSRVSRLMVVEGDRLVGIVSLKDMLKFLSLKVELENGR